MRVAWIGFDNPGPDATGNVFLACIAFQNAQVEFCIDGGSVVGTQSDALVESLFGGNRISPEQRFAKVEITQRTGRSQCDNLLLIAKGSSPLAALVSVIR